jgi:hypothetical protein
MSWKNIVNQIGYDEETQRLLQISVDFLSMFFGYNEVEANKLMKSFLSLYSKNFDEDMLHHESSYRVSAIVHYLVGLNGERNKLQEWLVENINNQRTPYEALEYFQEHYFDKS